LVFQNGRIIERGSFQELVCQGGFFAQLVATQFQNPAATEPGTLQNEAAVPSPSDSM
jgi:hypothetical protein